ncbi:MAG: PadR family transcriptional regulator [archaeon]
MALVKCGCVCDMRGMLSFLMLFLLSKRPMHGQELARELGKRKGSKPSPGTIYPALAGLKAEGLIAEKKKGKMIVYTLTKKGKTELWRAKRVFGNIFEGVMR